MGAQAAPWVLQSDNLQQHEQLLLRLLGCIKDQYSTFITTEQAKQIDAVVDSFVSEGRKAEKEQYGGTGNRILANLTQEPTTTPGDYDEGGHSSASTQETASVGGTTNTRKRKRVEEYVPLVHTAKKPTGSVLSLKNSSPFKSNETGKTPQSASMVRPGGIQLVVPAPAVASQESAKKGDIDRLLDGRILEQKAAAQRDRARRLVEQNRMVASRKLSLVLDLDHTLLNSTKFVDVDPLHEELLRRKEKQDRGKPRRHLFRLRHMGLWTKLRPGIWNFLEKANELFELHICTLGNRAYAAEMAKLLDPTGCLFAGRVMSRRDDGDRMVSERKDLNGVLGLECAAVIIDDTPGVWPRHCQPNLIAVERYHFFASSRRKFGLPGPSLLEMERDEREEDGTLASSLAIIRRIHDDFFSSHSDGDCRKLLLTKPKD
ncbi:hypothetical protein OPV22_019702 [Ensete ventricosum]|uniref:RNA polymerase II C-terminal domain phosphatase-like n=1 Tax=Ensete ventricosum TaxID=4639 RepID=A0AAV8QLE5_ENSVE|nr:hypothetical protein OPV22_019702 [Ensete ventricosum]